MKTGTFLQGATVLLLLATALQSAAAPIGVDTTDASNGITDLYSATFDPPLNPCTGSDPAYCSFFGGQPGPARAIVVTPSPTGVDNGVPVGIAPVPAAGSYLDLTRDGGNTQVTLTGGTILFSPLVLTISGTTIVNASGAGVVFNAAPQTAAIDGNGRAEFLVNLNPATAVDFSTFAVIVGPPNGSCSGPLCGLIPILTLDMVRYRLLIDFSPDFSTFTADFIGQTGNNSLLSITMNSVVPNIAVTDSVAPATDLLLPFGDVTELGGATQTVTVTNSGTGNLVFGTIGGANALAAPFAIVSDTCSSTTLVPAASCTFDVAFSPVSVGSFSDSLDIPSNDPDAPSITVSVSGNGTAQPVPNISVTDSVAPTTDQSVPFGSAGIGATLDETVTVTNEGNADLVLGTVASANGLIAPFSVASDSCSGQTLPAASSCSLHVLFQPTGPGVFVDTFDIPSNDSADPTITISVSGGGTSLATPDISVTDDALPANDLIVPFGNLTEGTTRDQTLTVTNNGTADLVLGAVAVTNPLAAPFSVVTDNCSAETLAPAATCNVVIRYAPPATGTASDSLDITSDDPDEPTVTVSVTGTGIVEGDGGTDTPKPGGADGGFMALDPATLLLLGGTAALCWQRRRRR